MKSETIPLAMPTELAAEMKKAAKETGLSMADVMRQSMKIGVRQLVRRLGKRAPLINVEPLPDAVLERLYKQRDDDAGDPQGVKKLMAAQPIHSPE